MGFDLGGEATAALGHIVLKGGYFFKGPPF